MSSLYFFRKIKPLWAGWDNSTARWHNHLPVIYTAAHSSTCILEKLVQLRMEEIHHDLMLLTIELPDNCSSMELSAGQLPSTWKTYPGIQILQRIGNAWLTKKSSLILFVPSAIDQNAGNVLINPLHPEADLLKISLPLALTEGYSGLKLTCRLLSFVRIIRYFNGLDTGMVKLLIYT